VKRPATETLQVGEDVRVFCVVSAWNGDVWYGPTVDKERAETLATAHSDVLISLDARVEHVPPAVQR
jgi:hypothetical protein